MPIRQGSKEEFGLYLKPEDVTRRWQQLMDKRGHGDLTGDEEREVAELETRMRRMRAQGGADSLAA